MLVVEYSGLNFNEALDLPVDLFCAIYRAAVINKLVQTIKGREYLEKAERLNTTSLDVDNFDAFKQLIEHKKG